jgi:hypothetical protein
LRCYKDNAPASQQSLHPPGYYECNSFFEKQNAHYTVPVAGYLAAKTDTPYSGYCFYLAPGKSAGVEECIQKNNPVFPAFQYRFPDSKTPQPPL